MMLTIETLQSKNYDRNKIWDPEEKLTPLFFAAELAGEVGEACNVVKKLEREKLGLRGSRDTIEHLGEELADVIIVACLLANQFDIDLDDAICEKFNKTSNLLQLGVTL